MHGGDRGGDHEKRVNRVVLQERDHQRGDERQCHSDVRNEAQKRREEPQHESVLKVEDGKDQADGKRRDQSHQQVSKRELPKHDADIVNNALCLLALLTGKEVQGGRPQSVLGVQHEKNQEGDEHDRHHEGINRADAAQQKLRPGRFLLEQDGGQVAVSAGGNDGTRTLLKVLGGHLQVGGDLLELGRQLGGVGREVQG